MKKLMIILILLIPIVAATRHFQYMSTSDVTLACPGCSYYISCESDSMMPTFNCNHTLIMKEPQGRKDLQLYDIIWFRSKGEYIIHRIIGTDYRGCYVTKGDNNWIKDKFHPCYYDIKFKIIGIIYEQID